MALPVRLERGRSTNPFELARNDFNTMINRLFGGIRETQDDAGILAGLSNYGVDIREDADHVYVEADLPGFRKDEVDVALENGTLTITAEHNEETPQPSQAQQSQSTKQSKQQGQSQPQEQPQTQNQDYLLRERCVRRFVRSFTLPPNIEERNVQAKLENGVLTITLNKLQESKPKHVQIA